MRPRVLPVSGTQAMPVHAGQARGNRESVRYIEYVLNYHLQCALVVLAGLRSCSTALRSVLNVLVGAAKVWRQLLQGFNFLLGELSKNQPGPRHSYPGKPCQAMGEPNRRVLQAKVM